jgi:GNAT superfamily N-acetyltransferase
MNIRFIKKEDINALVDLCEAHAIFEQADYEIEGKADNLQKHLFQENPALKCLVLEVDGSIQGYATFMKQYSTWEADFYIFLDTIFIGEKVRRAGYGEKIMQEVKNYAKSEGCESIQWQTPDFNKDGIKFYKKMGAQSLMKERFYWNV